MKLRPQKPKNLPTLHPALLVPQPAPGEAQSISVVQKIPEFLFGDHPSIFLTGAPGSGKSTALEILLRSVVRSSLRPGLLFLDPHGTSAKKFYHWCLAQGRAVADRVLYLHFADTHKIPSIDLLHVPGQDVGSLAWNARVTTIVEIIAKILLAAWGETDMNSKPILFKFIFRTLSTLARAGLPLGEARMFLNVFDPIYTTLCDAAPTLMDRDAMLELAELRPADRMAQMDSGANRLSGFLSNPIIENIFGRAAADGALTMEQLYANRLIVIVNLETGGVLRTMDVEILANAMLSLAIYSAMNTSQPHLHFLACDELPVFRSSSDLLTRVALPQCRKYLLRTIGCAQGASTFVDGTEDKLLQAFLALSGVRLYFRHNSETDCAYFGRGIAMTTYSPMLIKYEHSTPMQFQEGHELRELVDTSEAATKSTTDTNGQSTATNKVQNWNDVTGDNDVETFRNAVDYARAETRAKGKTRQAGHGGAEGHTEQNSASQARMTGRTHGITRKQQLVPIIKTRDVITSVQFFTKEELDALAATFLANLKVGSAIMHVSGSPPAHVGFPYAADPFTQTPKFGQKVETTHRALLEARPEFATIEQIEQYRKMLRAALLRRLTTIANERHREYLELSGPNEPKILPPPDDPDDTPLEI